MIFPSYSKVFSNITGKTSLLILKTYRTPVAILNAPKDVIVSLIATSSRKGLKYAREKYNKLIEAANLAKYFGHHLESVFDLMQMNIDFIEIYNSKIDIILSKIRDFTDKLKDEKFVKQIHLLDSIKGIGFISAVTLMCEIGDFEAFSKPKQLFAYFGLDPCVKESGNFKGTRNSMSKRGSRLARRVLFTIALVSVRGSKSGKPNNPVIHAFYEQKKLTKPKMVALGAVMHKISNLIFAVLRDHKPFVMRTPEQHRLCYNSNFSLVA